MVNKISTTPYIGNDNGSEFKAQFKQMCDNYGMKEKPSSSYNPQSNGIVERVHQVLGNALRTFELENKELDTNEDPWGPFLSAAAWAIGSKDLERIIQVNLLWERFAIGSTVHTTLDATPGQKKLQVSLTCCRGTHHIKDSTHTVRYYLLEDSVLQ
jgi:hypothetical protein